MPDGWVRDKVEAYGLTHTVVLQFLRTKFENVADGDFSVQVNASITLYQFI